MSTNHAPLEMLRASDFPAQPVEWLWPEKIPLGKVTLLIGDPGVGKSLVALDIAARISQATPWPDQCSRHAPCAETETEPNQSKEQGRPAQPLSNNVSSPPSLPVSPSSVLLLSAQDDIVDTIRPRLDANGADSTRIFLLPSISDLRHDLAQLRAALDRAPDCRLIIIDPINAYVGPSDSHFQVITRKVLTPLARLAADRGVAVLAVAHFRKTEGAAIYRAAGSMGFVAAARAVWTVCRDPAQPGRHFFLPIKNNLAPATTGLSYSIQSHQPTGAPALAWDATPIAAQEGPEPPTQQAAERRAARKFLRHALANGPRPSRDVIHEGEQRGFLRRTLQRAFHELSGHTAKRGLLQGWWWSLFDQSNETNDAEMPETPDIFEDVTEDVTENASFEQDIAASIATLERIRRQCPLDDDPPHEATRAERKLREKTGNPILDDLLASLSADTS